MSFVDTVVLPETRARMHRALLVVLLLAAAGSLVGAAELERGNRPYTANFVTSADHAFGVALFAVTVLGAVILGLRRSHPTGWLIVGSGVLLGLDLLFHGISVRLNLVTARGGPGADAATWLATWLVVPALGMLPFVLATWPDGRVESRWVRRLLPIGLLGLGLATAAQAFAPDDLDGVASEHRIPNPLGASWLDSVAGPATTAGLAAVAGFGVIAAVDIVVRGVQARGDRRRQLQPVSAAVVLVTVAVVVGLLGGTAVFVLAVVTPVAGAGLVVAAWAIRRVERSEEARGRLIAEREAERKRLRRELHDGVGPILAALRLELDGTGIDPSGPAHRLLADALAEVRRISRDLRPVALDELGLIGAIRHQAQLLQNAGGPAITVRADSIDDLEPEIEVVLFRVASEAMTNVVRHAGARTCVVTLDRSADEVLLRIADDGHGIRSAVDGAGVPAMRARTAEVNGRCSIRSSAAGTVVEAAVPAGRR